MRSWILLLGGWLVWTVHFFSLYAIASVFLTSTLSRILTLIVTVACAAANGLLLWRVFSAAGRAGDELSRWIYILAGLAAIISLLAVLWQGLPALLA